MWYALNTTPINGWETKGEFGDAQVVVSAQTGAGFAGLAKLGRGAAPIALNSNGYGRLFVKGKADKADAALSATGFGRVAKLGAGNADIAVDANGIGYARIFIGGESNIVIDADGDGVVIPRLGGRARITVEANASGLIAVRGQGSAAIEISMKGEIDTRPVRWGGGVAYISSDAYGHVKQFMRGKGATQTALTANGRAKDNSVHYGEGVAVIELLPIPASYFTYRQVFAAGEVSIQLVAKAGMPKTIPVPDLWRDAPSMRVMVASQEIRRRAVQNDGRL
jgi:hypothetical protein